MLRPAKAMELENRVAARTDDNLAIGPIHLPLARYPTNGRILEYHRLASQRLETIPGVVAAGSIGRFFAPDVSDTDPLTRREGLYAVKGGTTDWPGGRPPALGGGGGGAITAGYFGTPGTLSRRS